MNIVKPLLVLILFSIIPLQAPLQAQITIETIDLPMEGTQLTISNQAAPEVDLLLADEVNPQTWDWTSLSNEGSTAVSFETTVGTPAENDFNNADFVRDGTLGSIFGFGLGAFDPPTTAYYETQNDGNVYFAGAVIELTFDSLGIDMPLLETEDDLYRAFSTGEIGDTYSTDGNYFTDIDLAAFGLDIPILSFIRLSLELETDVVMDAFGEMILPDSTYEVLRYNESTTTRIKLAPYGSLGNFDFEIPIDDIPLPDSLAALGQIFIDTTVTSKAYRFYTDSLQFPVASANVFETDSTDFVSSVEYYSDPPVLSTAIVVNDTSGVCGQIFFSAGSTGSSLSYDWNFGDGETGNFPVALHNYQAEGTYEVILNVTDGFDNVVSDTQTVTIECPVVVDFLSSNTPDSCQQVFLVNNSEGLGLNYTWDFGDGNTLENNDQFVSYNYNADGEYTISLLAINETNDTIISNQTVQIECGASLAAIFTIEASDSCQQVILNNISTGYNTTSIWSLGDGSEVASDDNTIVYNYEADGSYEVTLQVTDAFDNLTTETQTVDINCIPPTMAIFSTTTNADSCQLINFINTSQGSNLQYQWDFGDGSLSTEANPSHSFANGDYEVSLTTTDEFDNTSTANIEINIDCVLYGIENVLDHNDYQVYPNPSTDIVWVELNEAIQRQMQITLYDLLGREVLSQETNEAKKFSIDLSQLATGTYTLKVFNVENTLLIETLIRN